LSSFGVGYLIELCYDIEISLWYLFFLVADYSLVLSPAVLLSTSGLYSEPTIDTLISIDL